MKPKNRQYIFHPGGFKVWFLYGRKHVAAVRDEDSDLYNIHADVTRTDFYRRFSSQRLSIFFGMLHALLICNTAGNVYFCTLSSRILLAEWDVSVKNCSELWQMIIRREAHSPLAFRPLSFIASSFQLFAPLCVASFLNGIKNSQRFANVKIRCEGSVTRDNFPRNDCCEENRR